MKQFKKVAILAALGLASVTAAQAQNDVYLGFNDAAGPSAAQNDFVIDLGLVSQFTTTSTYSGSFSGSTFSTAFSADASALNDVAAGIVEANNPTGQAHQLYVTGASAPTISTRSAYNNSVADITGIITGEYGSTSSSSAWSSEVAVSPSQYGFYSTSVSTVLQDHGIVSSLSSGIVTENLYESTQSSTLANGSAFSLVGSFTINANNDTVSFTGANVAAVPEPATYGLLSGAGMLLLGLRRQFSRKA